MCVCVCVCVCVCTYMCIAKLQGLKACVLKKVTLINILGIKGHGF